MTLSHNSNDYMRQRAVQHRVDFINAVGVFHRPFFLSVADHSKIIPISYLTHLDLITRYKKKST